MTMLKILGRKTSSNVQKVLWCCSELDIPFEREDVGGPFGKNNTPEYLAITTTITMNAEDMKEAGIAANGQVRVRSDNGEAVFLCKEGKVPRGMIFVPYGPPTCKLMGQTTDGTGMPTSKGWEVEVEPVAADTPKG